jgi:hypothetical protein
MLKDLKQSTEKFILTLTYFRGFSSKSLTFAILI